MLHHENYREFCHKHFHKLINHDDTIPEAKLKEYVEKTDLAWKERSVSLAASTVPSLSNPTDPIESPVPHINKQVAIIKEKSSIKKKIKNLLSLKKDTIITQPATFVVVDIRSVVKKYVDEKSVFGLDYKQGSYTQSRPYRPRLSGLSRDNSRDTIKEEPQEVKSSAYGEEELSYEKEKISFHDRSKTIIIITNYKCLNVTTIGDIKEFIKLNNSDTVLDSKFDSTKASGYGFIGYKFLFIKFLLVLT